MKHHIVAARLPHLRLLRSPTGGACVEATTCSARGARAGGVPLPEKGGARVEGTSGCSSTEVPCRGSCPRSKGPELKEATIGWPNYIVCGSRLR